MLVHSDRVLLPDGAALETALWSDGAGRARYRLRYGRDGAWLVQYDNEAGRGDRRLVRSRATRYEFRSVEQLRYDFERDIEDLADGPEARA
jgi:hypothetical protein